MRPLPLFWRAIVLRVLLASVVICLPSSVLSCRQAPESVTLDLALVMYIPLVFVLLHHVLRLWSGKHWLGIYEMLCSLAEVGGGAYAIYYLWIDWIVIDPHYTGDLAMGVSWSVLEASVFAAFLILLCDTATNRGKNLMRKYDFSAGLGSARPGSQWSFIFGSSSTRKRFSTDNRPIRWIRGGIAILCLVALSLMAFYVFIGRPLWQRGRSVIKISKAPISLLSNELEKLGNIEVHVILDVPDALDLQEDVPNSFANVTGTTRPQRRSGRYTSPIVSRSLVASPNDGFGHYNGSGGQSMECHNSSHLQQNESLYGVSCLFPSEGEIDFSSLPNLEILITVDFSSLGNASHVPSQIGVYPGVTNSSTVSDIEPIYLGPGSHLYGLSSISLKERSASQRFAAIGIPKYRLLPLLDVKYLFQDWSSSVSNNNTASLRLFVPSLDEVQIEREYFESSVLDGFALIGGVWTFINGLFAAIFGSTLLLVLFGIKPLSIYGLIHLFQTKGSLVGRDYVLSPEDRDWIIAILSEHLLDDDIKASRGLQSNSSPARPDSSHDEKGSTETEQLMGRGPAESA